MRDKNIRCYEAGGRFRYRYLCDREDVRSFVVGHVSMPSKSTIFSLVSVFPFFRREFNIRVDDNNRNIAIFNDETENQS